MESTPTLRRNYVDNDEKLAFFPRARWTHEKAYRLICGECDAGDFLRVEIVDKMFLKIDHFDSLFFLNEILLIFRIFAEKILYIRQRSGLKLNFRKVENIVPSEWSDFRGSFRGSSRRSLRLRSRVDPGCWICARSLKISTFFLPFKPFLHYTLSFSQIVFVINLAVEKCNIFRCKIRSKKRRFITFEKLQATVLILKSQNDQQVN